jgi:hypothetical protein
MSRCTPSTIIIIIIIIISFIGTQKHRKQKTPKAYVCNLKMGRSTYFAFFRAVLINLLCLPFTTTPSLYLAYWDKWLDLTCETSVVGPVA